MVLSALTVMAADAIEQKNVVVEESRIVAMQEECARIYVSATHGTLITQY